MSYEQKDLSGSLFKNKRKERDSHPEYTGSVTIDGRAYWLSAWLKKDKHSETYMSLALKPKDERAGDLREASGTKPAKHASHTVNPLDDDIPFAP
jgi:predicted DNA-binding protein (MmcQ/YjbR family)